MRRELVKKREMTTETETDHASKRARRTKALAKHVPLPLSLYPETRASDAKRLTRMRILGDTVARIGAMPVAELEAIREKGAKDRPRRLDVEAKTKLRVIVVESDTLDLAKEIFENVGVAPLVLNMANETHPGGGYRSGSAAQEENLFRRSDLHFCFAPGEVVVDPADPSRQCYSHSMQRLISGVDGSVYISEAPRVCIRGSEDFNDPTLGYELYAKDEAFPFYEMRSAAYITSKSPDLEEVEARRRIRAQLASARDSGHRVLVLSAFGCGAFGGTPELVARIYCEEIRKHEDFFSLIAFGIFYAGWGANNHDAFCEVFYDGMDSASLSLGRSDYDNRVSRA